MIRSLPSIAASIVFFMTCPVVADDVSVRLGASDSFVIEDSTATERLRVDEAGNIHKDAAPFLYEVGSDSTFLGRNAGSGSAGTGNTAVGKDVLISTPTGSNNSALGTQALRDLDGSSNAAFGYRALEGNVGPPVNESAAFGAEALSETRSGPNSAFGFGALRLNLSGTNNSAFGWEALSANVGGVNNSAFGMAALSSSAGAGNNSAFGTSALGANGDGTENTAVGSEAVLSNLSGNANTAVGRSALRNSTGSDNSALGADSLVALTSGSGNIGVGKGAGSLITTGSNNILIGNVGVATESGVIRIGTPGTQSAVYIAGMENCTAGCPIYEVRYNPFNGRIHYIAGGSSARFKEAIHDMGDASRLLMSLRPVTFRYREGAGDGGASEQYGLIAEEVAEVAPELVGRDEQGRPLMVHYDRLPSLLLNEMQRQQHALERQRTQIGEQRERLVRFTTRLELLESQLENYRDTDQ